MQLLAAPPAVTAKAPLATARTHPTAVAAGTRPVLGDPAASAARDEHVPSTVAGGSEDEYKIPKDGVFMHGSVECVAAEPRSIFLNDTAAKVV